MLALRKGLVMSGRCESGLPSFLAVAYLCLNHSSVISLIPSSASLIHLAKRVSQLRLVNTVQHDLQKICNMALQFEKGTFDNAPDKVRHLTNDNL
jgi:hypothetical protein